MKKIIFFDFDGVIVDTFHLAFTIEHEADFSLSKEKYADFFRGNPYDFCRPDEDIMGLLQIVWVTFWRKRLVNYFFRFLRAYKSALLVLNTPRLSIRMLDVERL